MNEFWIDFLIATVRLMNLISRKFLRRGFEKRKKSLKTWWKVIRWRKRRLNEKMTEYWDLIVGYFKLNQPKLPEKGNTIWQVWSLIIKIINDILLLPLIVLAAANPSPLQVGRLYFYSRVTCQLFCLLRYRSFDSIKIPSSCSNAAV